MSNMNPDPKTQKLRDTLHTVGNFRPSYELIDMLLEYATPVVYKPKQVVVGPGQITSDLYLIKSGICQLSYFNGLQEVTFGFGTTGTIHLSPKGFYSGQGAHFTMTTVTETEILQLTKQAFMHLIDTSHDFARWMFDMSMSQIYVCELKAEFITGTAREMYNSVTDGIAREKLNQFDQQYPEMINAVSSKALASYLGITQSYLSNLRQAINRDKRTKPE